MLTIYLTSLIIGGVFVGLSAIGVIGKDADVSHDVDADIDADVDTDIDADVDADHDFDTTHALTVTDASHGLEPAKRTMWLPVLSLRFWTFGSTFFGLTGTLLTTLTATGVILAAALSAGVGAGVGTASAWIVRWMRKPVGEVVRLSEYRGQMAQTVLPLPMGGITRIRLNVQGRERDMLARAQEPVALPSGTNVVVLGIDDNGQAQIAPEETIFTSEKS